MNNLDFLLNHTYGQIMDITAELEQQMKTLRDASNELSNAVVCNNIMVRTIAKLDEASYGILNHFISPIVDPD